MLGVGAFVEEAITLGIPTDASAADRRNGQPRPMGLNGSSLSRCQPCDAGTFGPVVEAGRVKRLTSHVLPRRLLVHAAVGMVMAAGTASTSAGAATVPSFSVYAWGTNYSADSLGTGSNSAWVSTPERVAAVQGVAIAAGDNQALALQADGTVLSWGGNSEGDLGHGTVNTNQLDYFDPPGRVVGLTEAVSIASGETHGLAARRDGSVWAWGGNNGSQLGMGPPSAPVLEARPVPGLSGVVAVAAGDYHSVALDRDGHVWTWGDNDDSQLRRPGTNTAPGRVEEVENAVAIAASGTQTVALLRDGHAMFWASSGLTPRPVEGVEGAVAIASGINHALALAGDGTVFGWGATGAGQLGSRATQFWPAQRIDGIEGVRSIAAGRDFSLFATNDGRVLRLGSLDGPADSSIPPEVVRTVATLPGLTAVAAGYRSGFALAGPQQSVTTTKPTATTTKSSTPTTTNAAPTPTTAKRPTSTTSGKPAEAVEAPTTTGRESAAVTAGDNPATPTSSGPISADVKGEQAGARRRVPDGSALPGAVAAAGLCALAAVRVRRRRLARRP